MPGACYVSEELVVHKAGKKDLEPEVLPGAGTCQGLVAGMG